VGAPGSCCCLAPVHIEEMNVSVAIHEFRISLTEREYLERLFAEDAALTSFPRPQTGLQGRIAIQLSREQIRYLRDYMGTRLAQVGFDENYEPNREGRILEGLIDRFFIGG